MNVTDEVEGWLVGWASRTGGSVQMHQGGVCTFTADGLPVQLTLSEENQWLLMAAIALDEDLTAHPSAALELLRYAHLGERTHRCGVSLAATGRAVIWHWLSTQALDITRLENSLNGFIATAVDVRQTLHSALGATPGQRHDDSGSPEVLVAALGAMRA